MKFSTIIIFGSEWKIFKDVEDDEVFEGDCAGYCDGFSKSIFIRKFSEKELTGVKDIGSMQRYILRHELIHAALLECGLGDNWYRTEMGHDETAIDWLAHKFVQLYNIFEQADAI